MSEDSPKTIYLKDYQQPHYWITKTELSFDLHDDFTRVTSVLTLEKNDSQSKDAPLVLHGQELELESVELNGETLTKRAFIQDDESLTINAPIQSQNILKVVTKIFPQKNTSLEGLYRSSKMYCTQCEAEGFRKITYYLDRPDVMSEFTTAVIADKASFPVLLSNGNLVASEDLDGGRHKAVWHDPFKKPSYLFALVAGDLEYVQSSFTTCSGREIDIRLYVEEKDLDKCDHAITSLKNSMRWDEEVYGREYDLDIFMIVAVDDFNMGAMENKGLNIFNTSCVLAKPETTTDAGFQRVEGVVAHEYFHNWSGNRVTCRDWFQLSLKEGFTVYRDQEFSADMGSRTVKRVEDVSMLRTAQFAEDGGPMAHAVQPASFIEISNFYTLTIYEKGAEIVRMVASLLGPEKFREGSDLYFARHDGEAVTIEDFIAAMAEVSGRDFTQFMNWYRQARTPQLDVKGQYDASAETYTLTFKQSCPPSPECEEKTPYLIPVSMGLLGDAGSLRLSIQGQAPDPEVEDNTTTVLEITEPVQTVVFEDVKESPVPSLLRGFSAPVKLKFPYSRDDLMCLMSRDDDGFNRWDAAQSFACQVIQEVAAALANEPSPSVDERFIQAYRTVLLDESLDPAMVALMLELPSEAYLAEQERVVDVDTIYHARQRVERKLAQNLKSEFESTYQRMLDTGPFSVAPEAIAGRSLKNVALHYMMVSGGAEAVNVCSTQFETATNMTDELSAFTAIVHSGKSSVNELKQSAVARFYDKWKNENLVMNHWLGVQASAPLPGMLARVKELEQHEIFDINNPNKIRALIAMFASRNHVNFHHLKGEGYGWLADKIIYLNATNPQIAARLVTPLTKWRRYGESRQALMKRALERILNSPGLSKDVYEVVSKSL